MRWNYDDSIRDEFSKGPHRDILIVPHATYVTPVAGGPPEITSKVPQFEWRAIPVYDEKEKKFVMMQKPFPKKDLITGEVLREDVEWIITNDDIVKEKFKYSHALNSDPNLTFSSCNAAMVQFTIRNKKQYVEELDDEGEPTGNYYWEQEIPNLQNYEFVEKDPNGNSRKIVGELSGNACIKVYTYINGDSSTLMYLGMFNVDEDKVVDNGYNRQITAYDFMAFFRDCDIFYWYKHLWTGINKLDNDFEDYTNDDEEKEQKKPDDYDAEVNWVRKPAKDLYPDRDGRWTIGEALTDLFTNFAAYDMITYEEEEVEVEDPDTHEMKKIKKTVAKLGNTVTNPNSYGRNYEEGNGYTGLGMPVMLDPDLFDNTKEYTIPTETGENVFECYGYMDALDIEFYQDPNIMKSESLSMGKFLEDIGLLAGRYPYIRNDHLQDDDWFDPATKTGNQNRYNNYEKCILTFKPLPSSKDDSKLPTYQMLDNTEISKGFSHESYTVDDIEVIKINFQDKSNIEYSRLTASQRKEKKSGNVQTFTFSDNIFVSYLVEKSDNEEIKSKLENYKALRNKIFGKENKKGNMSSKALFAQGYYNMKYRSYVPYELTTFADPVRDVGDRIKITYTDVITGEHVSFYSYILEREMNGIQKCLDTYRAQGDGLNPIFSNYKTGSKYQSGSSYAASSFGYNAVYSGTGAGGSSGSGALGITPSDLVQYWRNFGIRLLDEPSDCQAKFVKGSDSSISFNSNMYVTSSYPQETYIKDGDTANPITVGGQEIEVKEGDYVKVKNYQNDDPAVPSTYYSNTVLYVYTANNKWELAESQWNGRTYLDVCGGYHEPTGHWQEDSDNLMVFLDHDDNLPIYNSDENIDEVEFTSYNLFIRPRRTDEPVDPNFPSFVGVGYYWKQKISKDVTNNKYAYGWADDKPEYLENNPPGEKVYDPSEYVPSYGDEASIFTIDEEGGYKWYTWYTWQYPGFWLNTENKSYPLLDIHIEDSTKKYVSLKWSDPQDITDWKPTPATWEGTVIVRKENSAPLHRWDGEKVVRTTTRDKYKTKAYKDEDIRANKVYYYGFFPYYTKISDPDHPIRFYTFTKSIRVETGVITYTPVIESITVDGNNATITYSIVAPADTIYTSIKLYGRIGETPKCDDTDDICEDILQSETEYVVGDLSYDIEYYFVIQCIDMNEAETNSNVMGCNAEDPVPPDLRPYINLINGTGFFFKDYIGTSDYGQGYVQHAANYPFNNYSYFAYQDHIPQNIGEIPTQYFPQYDITEYWLYQSQIIDLNIEKTGNNYSYSINITNLNPAVNYWYGQTNNAISFYDKAYPDGRYWGGISSNLASSTFHSECNDSLLNVFIHISKRFRNINIYVDGVLWSKANNIN